MKSRLLRIAGMILLPFLILMGAAGTHTRFAISLQNILGVRDRIISVGTCKIAIGDSWLLLARRGGAQELLVRGLLPVHTASALPDDYFEFEDIDDNRTRYVFRRLEAGKVTRIAAALNGAATATGCTRNTDLRFPPSLVCARPGLWIVSIPVYNTEVGVYGNHLDHALDGLMGRTTSKD